MCLRAKLIESGTGAMVKQLDKREREIREIFPTDEVL